MHVHISHVALSIYVPYGWRLFKMRVCPYSKVNLMHKQLYTNLGLVFLCLLLFLPPHSPPASLAESGAPCCLEPAALVV